MIQKAKANVVSQYLSAEIEHVVERLNCGSGWLGDAPIVELGLRLRFCSRRLLGAVQVVIQCKDLDVVGTTADQRKLHPHQKIVVHRIGRYRDWFSGRRLLG
jgi:hypothetical protein